MRRTARALDISRLLDLLRAELSESALPREIVLQLFVQRHDLQASHLLALTRLMSDSPRRTAASESVQTPESIAGREDRSPLQSTDAMPVRQGGPSAKYNGSSADVGVGSKESPEYDEFGLPVDAPVRSSEDMPAGEVQLCVNDLMDDWLRQGQLSLEDVRRATDRRQLSAVQMTEVADHLQKLDVVLSTPSPSSADRDDGDVVGEARSSIPDALGAYLQSIAAFRLLRAEEEVQLGRRIRAGQLADDEHSGPAGARLGELVTDGRAAHHTLVCANLRLVVNIARHPRYRRARIDLLERIQFGNIGLMRAADKFDHSLGYKFSTYATWWIRQAIERGMADSGRMIRLPVHLSEKLNKFRRVERELELRLGRMPTIRELATDLGEDPATVASVLSFDINETSLDAELMDGGGAFSLLDVVADLIYDQDPAIVVTDQIAAMLTREELSRLVSAKELVVLDRRLGLDGDAPATLDEIGTLLGVSRERVRQIQKKTLERLRDSPQSGRLREILMGVDLGTASLNEVDGGVQPKRRARASRSNPAMALSESA